MAAITTISTAPAAQYNLCFFSLFLSCDPFQMTKPIHTHTKHKKNGPIHSKSTNEPTKSKADSRINPPATPHQSTHQLKFKFSARPNEVNSCNKSAFFSINHGNTTPATKKPLRKTTTPSALLHVLIYLTASIVTLPRGGPGASP